MLGVEISNLRQSPSSVSLGRVVFSFHFTIAKSILAASRKKTSVSFKHEWWSSEDRKNHLWECSFTRGERKSERSDSRSGTILKADQERMERRERLRTLNPSTSIKYARWEENDDNDSATRSAIVRQEKEEEEEQRAFIEVVVCKFWCCCCCYLKSHKQTGEEDKKRRTFRQVINLCIWLCVCLSVCVFA